MRSAYYFRQHLYTLVPRHLREDLAWIADTGTDNVCLAILEQDLYAAKANLDIICREAERVGLRVTAVPSRWAGILAGAPKVPSTYAANHPETWVLGEDGRPFTSRVSGPAMSVHHPATIELFRSCLETLLAWPIAGIVWDEPKTLHLRDRSLLAMAALGARAPIERHVDAFADFLDARSLEAKALRPGLHVSLFVYSQLVGYEIDRLARMASLDFFGCDGRPWRLEDGGVLEGPDKVLLPNAERFLAAARTQGKGGLILIENHAMNLADAALMDRRLPEVLALGAEHLLYYYYPRDLEDPDAQMAIMARHLRAARA